MPLIYRSMQIDGDKPKVGRSATALGVRIDTQPADIVPDGKGYVSPNTGGMPVTPSPSYLPPWRVFVGLAHIVEGARAKDSSLRIWKMGSGPFVKANVSPDLVLQPDAADQGLVKHGVVEPSRPMPLAAYEQALADTRDLWVVDETGD